MTPCRRSGLRCPHPVGEFAGVQFIVAWYLKPLIVPSPLSLVATKHSKTVVVSVRSSVEPPLTGEHDTEMMEPSMSPFATCPSAIVLTLVSISATAASREARSALSRFCCAACASARRASSAATRSASSWAARLIAASSAAATCASCATFHIAPPPPTRTRATRAPIAHFLGRRFVFLAGSRLDEGAGRSSHLAPSQ